MIDSEEREETYIAHYKTNLWGLESLLCFLGDPDLDLDLLFDFLPCFGDLLEKEDQWIESQYHNEKN